MKIRSYIFYFLTAFSFFQQVKADDGHPTPIANFEVINLCYGSVTTFSNTSTSLQNPAYVWQIYQTGFAAPVYTASTANITFQFPAKTTYTVYLYVANYVTSTHFHWDDVTRVIKLDSTLIANFNLKECHSRFTNLSCCANSYLWDFGDGTPTSTLTSPVHTYTTGNTYTVTLVAYNGTQSDTNIQAVNPYPDIYTGDFTVFQDKDSICFRSVIDSSISSAFSWHWTFGDGAVSDIIGEGGWKVKHYYQARERDSIYPVFLLVKNQCFSKYGQKNVFIKGTGKIITGTSVFPSFVVYGYLNIETNELDKLKEIKIIDGQGKHLKDLVPSEKPNGYYIYVGQLASGLYITELVFSDRTERYKIIKE